MQIARKGPAPDSWQAKTNKADETTQEEQENNGNGRDAVEAYRLCFVSIFNLPLLWDAYLTFNVSSTIS